MTSPLNYALLGWPVLPLHGIVNGFCTCSEGANCTRFAGKHPYGKFAPHAYKSATLDHGTIELWQSTPGLNYGISLGNEIDGKYLVCVDVDPRNGGDETEKVLQAFPTTLTQDSGGNGRHYFYLSPVSPSKVLLGPGIELLGHGSHVVVAPSTHRSGKQYTWRNWGYPVQPLPEWITDRLRSASVRPDHLEVDAKNTFMGAAFEYADMLGDILPKGVRAVKCPWHFKHTDGRGRGGDSSTVILPPTASSNFGGFKCHHSHCSDLDWKTVLRTIPKTALELAAKKFPPPGGTEIPDSFEDPEDFKPVLAKLRYRETKSGTYAEKDLTNALTVLTHDPRWKGKIKHNDFNKKIEVFTPPWDAEYAPRFQSPYWEDETTNCLVTWFQRKYNIDFPKMVVDDAVNVVAYANAYHPVRDYFDALEWDGCPRVGSWLIDFVRSRSPAEYCEKVGTWWLLQGVARIYRPGEICRGVLVIEGVQDSGKSQVFSALCPQRAWFCDSEIQIGTAEGMKQLQGKLIIEFQELASMKGKSAESIKAYLTSTADDFRESYGKRSKQVPRQCIFGATTNDATYLNDPTGNTRFWPVRSDGVPDYAGIRGIRDQLWAEAIVLFRKGLKWWAESEDDKRLFGREQEARNQSDEWEGLILNYIHRAKKEYLSVGEVLQEAIGVPRERWTTGDQVRVGKLLSKMGFIRAGRDSTGKYRWTRSKH